MATIRAPGRAARRPLPWPLEFYRSAVGKKWVMAVTGLMLIGFVIAHMAGNLHVFQGEEEINKYGVALREIGGDLIPRTYLLWALRLGLIAAFVLHIHAAYALTMINRRARPIGYKGGRHYVAANWASRTMRISGVIVGVFLLFHLADMTWGWTIADFRHGEPYHNLVTSLSRPAVGLFYVIAVAMLIPHLYHGAWSMFQDLGINNPRINRARRVFATAVAVLVPIGFMIVPIAILVGAID